MRALLALLHMPGLQTLTYTGASSGSIENNGVSENSLPSWCTSFRLSGSRQHCCSGLSGHVTLMLGIVFSFNESGTSTQGFAVGLCSRQSKPDRFMGPRGLVGFIHSFSHFQLGVNGRCCNDPARQAAYSTDKYRISSQSAIISSGIHQRLSTHIHYLIAKFFVCCLVWGNGSNSGVSNNGGQDNTSSSSLSHFSFFPTNNPSFFTAVAPTWYYDQIQKIQKKTLRDRSADHSKWKPWACRERGDNAPAGEEDVDEKNKMSDDLW